MALVIVDQALYVGGDRRPCGDLSDELAALRAEGAPGDFLWIGLKNPTQSEFDEVNAELQLHPLAVEDAIQGRQRAKVEIYDNSVFVVLKPVRYVEETSDIETGELMCFVGDRFIVTVRRGEAAPLAGLRHRLETEPALMRRGPMAVLHAIVDVVVDNYMLIDAELSTDLDDIETGVFSGADMDSSSIYRLKREVLEFRRAAAPLAPPLMALHEHDNPHVTDSELRLQFRDVSDHLQSVIDHVESYDRLLTDVLGAHLTQITVQQNNDMRRISAWVAIAAVPTMIAGIYGMNFDNMPELRASIHIGSGEFKYGYFVILAVMAIVCGSLYRAFKRSGWL